MDPRTNLVGRESQIARVQRLSTGTRLLTLTGPGGIGKTRLALEVARRETDTNPGGAILVELASIRDERQVLPAIGTALGLRDWGDTELVPLLSEQLERARPLLVVDNFEHVAGAAPGIGELLDASPSLRVIVTSRVPLHLSGEQEYPVPPLELPHTGQVSSEQVAAIEAVELFVQRARAVDPDFELTDENADTIAAICRRLEGLPLAIELAAPRLKLLSPGSLLDRLDDRLGILTGGATDAPARQRTLRDTIDWSYELLPERERLVFVRCSVFVGGFRVDGARAVATNGKSSESLLDELGLLVDHNLLTVAPGAGGEPRFRMLETIREFAQEELGRSDIDDVRSRHATYAVGVAEVAAAELRGPDHRVRLDRLIEDLDDLRASLIRSAEGGDVDLFLRLVTALAPYWRYYGDIREGRRWLQQAVAATGWTSPIVRARVLRSGGWLETVAGELDGAQAMLEQSLELFERLEEPREIAITLYHLGSTLRDSGQIAAARERFERGVDLARKVGDPATEGRLLQSLAWIAGIENRPADRAEIARQAMEASLLAGDRQRVALCLNEYAWGAWDAGETAVALGRWDECVGLLRELGERAFLGSYLLIRGFARIRAGYPDTARGDVIEGAELTGQVGAIPDVITAMAHAADWLARVGHRDRAVAHLVAADQVRLDHGLALDRVFPMAVVLDDVGMSTGDMARLRSATLNHPSPEDALNDALRDLQSATILSSRLGRGPDPSRYALTPRELEVLALIVAGRSNAEIADELFISRKTASVHVANIKGKFGAASRVEIATMALERGLDTQLSSGRSALTSK